MIAVQNFATLLLETPLELEGRKHASLVDVYLKTVKTGTKGVSVGPSDIVGILQAPAHELRGWMITKKVSLALDVVKYFALAFYSGPEVCPASLLSCCTFLCLCV